MPKRKTSSTQSKGRDPAPDSRKVAGTRDSSGRFKKGKSGNPGGRKSVDQSVTKLAQDHTQDAINTLVEICNDKKAAKNSRVAAAREILDRGWGRPMQSVEHSGPDGAAIPHSVIVNWVEPEEHDE